MKTLIRQENPTPLFYLPGFYLPRFSLFVAIVLTATHGLLHSAALAQTNPPAIQPNPTAPAFEVATIRLNAENRHWWGTRLEGREFETSAMSLSSLVDLAYSDGVAHTAVVTDHSAPKWIDSDQFDIHATIDDAYLNGWEKLTPKQQMEIVRPMIRQLLQERFHVKLHSEPRPTPVYALVQAKGGAHVKEVPAPPAAQGDSMEAQARWMRDNPGKASPGSILCTGGQCTASAVKISNAVGQIGTNAKADHTVIDDTGLTGYYDFVIPYPAQDEEHPMAVVADALGMRFEKRTIPIQTYIIESADKPTLDGPANGPVTPPPTPPSH